MTLTGPGRLAALVLGALVLRLGVALATGKLHPPSRHWDFGFEPGAVAVSLAERGAFADPFMVPTGPTAVVGPAIPAIWSLFVLAFGAHTAATWRCFVLLSVALSALGVVVVHRIGRRVAGETVAWLAAVAWAVHPLSVVGASGWIGSGTLYALFVGLVIERFIAMDEAFDGATDMRSRMRAAASCGVLLGLGLWVEPLLIPFTGAWALVAGSRRRFGLALAGLAAAALAGLIVSPWLVRNLLAFHEPVFLRSWGGPELLVGATTEPGAAAPEVRLHPLRNPAELAELRRVGEAAYARGAGARALAAIRARPAHWMVAVGWRYANFWLGRLSWWTISGTHPLLAGPLSALRGAVYVVPPLLAGWGLLLLRRERPAAFRTLALLFATFPVTYALTHVEARYRLAIEPAILVAASIPIARLAAGRKARAVA